MTMKEPATGNNRTGIATAASEDQSAMMGYADRAGQIVPPAIGDGLTDLRASFAREMEENVGSVPPPATVTGKLKSAIGTLSGSSMAVFLDRLGQRLAFERQGSRLYEGLIAKYQAAAQSGILGAQAPALDDLVEIHDEEVQHFALLQQAIADLGGDATAQTPAADVAGVANMGLPQVVNDPRTTFWQSLEAMLVAELVDNDGWEMLIDLAAGLGYDDLAASFRAAKDDEEEHLRRVRTWLTGATMAEAGAS